MGMSVAFRLERRVLIGYLCVPVFLNLFVVVIPLIGAVYYSLFETYNYRMTFVGLSNFRELLTDRIFWHSLRNNILIIVLGGFTQIIIAFTIAVTMTTKYLAWKRALQAVFFMPVVVSSIVVSVLWKLIYSSRFGILNALLEGLGLQALARNWLGDPSIALFAVMVPLVWQYIGLYLVIFLAGLTGIPQDILDVASIDGASGFRKAIHIVIPLLKGTINVALILVLSGGLKIFEQVYAMTGGGPGYSSMVLAQYAYTMAFSRNNHGYGAAIALNILVISLIFVVGATKVIGGTRQNEY
jgi:raffinose/stachyose/melibiose transport system permease protein